MLFNKLLYIAHDKDEQYDGGQDEAYINTRPLRELHALAGIGFLNEALPRLPRGSRLLETMKSSRS